MRVTLGQFKLAARDPGLRRSGLLGSQPRPTPFPMAAAAIRRLHRDNPVDPVGDLEATINRSDYWGPSGSSQAQGWAQNVIDHFERYVELNRSDGRPVMPASVSTDIAVGSNEIGVTIDVVVLDPHGYVPRWPLWDKPLPDRGEACILAAPLAAALEEEAGRGRTTAVEIWHLRSGTQFVIPASDALGALQRAERIVQDFVS